MFIKIWKGSMLIHFCLGGRRDEGFCLLLPLLANFVIVPEDAFQLLVSS